MTELAEEVRDLKDIVLRLERKLDEVLFHTDLQRRRNSIYIGQEVALTHLFDDTPIYVNCNDFGPPANFINGGYYEEDNLDILLSFVRDDTVFLDVGANLGFFSLLIGRRVHPVGQVHAVEPNPALMKLLRASVYLNGLGSFDGSAGLIVSHRIAAGDRDAHAVFAAPDQHLGGATEIDERSGYEGQTFSSEIRRLDDILGPDFACDLVKIDVEGHELDAMRGMREILQRSPGVKILFEKLGASQGDELAVEGFLAELGLSMYAVDPGARLRKIQAGALANFSGYVLATAEELDGSPRRRFAIYPRQLRTSSAATVAVNRNGLSGSGKTGDILFFGPYWFLRAGIYRVTLIGEVVGELRLALAARLGHECAAAILTGRNPSFVAVVKRDLLLFECVGVAAGDETRLELEQIQIESVY
jgi:FkbM family methyltransferase